MFGNLFIHVPSEAQKLSDFGKGLENYFKTSEDFFNALHQSFQIGDDMLNGRGGAYQYRQLYSSKNRPKDTSTFYTVPCEFFDQQSKPYTPQTLARAIQSTSGGSPLLLIFRYDDKDKDSLDFTAEIRSWYTEHQELRQYMKNDDQAMPHEPKRLMLLKYRDERTREEFSFVLQDTIMYRKVGNNSNAFAIVIFKAEQKKF